MVLTDNSLWRGSKHSIALRVSSYFVSMYYIRELKMNKGYPG